MPKVNHPFSLGRVHAECNHQVQTLEDQLSFKRQEIQILQKALRRASALQTSSRPVLDLTAEKRVEQLDWGSLEEFVQDAGWSTMSDQERINSLQACMLDMKTQITTDTAALESALKARDELARQIEDLEKDSRTNELNSKKEHTQALDLLRSKITSLELEKNAQSVAFLQTTRELRENDLCNKEEIQRLVNQIEILEDKLSEAKSRVHRAVPVEPKSNEKIEIGLQKEREMSVSLIKKVKGDQSRSDESLNEAESTLEGLQSLSGSVKGPQITSWKDIIAWIESLIAGNDELYAGYVEAHEIIDQQHLKLESRSDKLSLIPSSKISMQVQTDRSLALALLTDFAQEIKPIIKDHPLDTQKYQTAQNHIAVLEARLEQQLMANAEIKRLIVQSAVGQNFGRQSSFWGSEESMESNLLERYNDLLVQVGDLTAQNEELEYQIQDLTQILEDLVLKLASL